MTEIDVLCCGLLTADLCFSISELPSSDEKVFANNFELRTGGPAANAALTVRLLGGHSQLIAQTDSSPTGQALINQLQTDGFNTSLVLQQVNGLTTAGVLTENSGMRRLISYKAKALPQNLPSSTKEVYPKVMLFDGHLPELSLKLIKHFPQAQTLLDAGSLHEGTEILADKVDWLITSAKFARIKTGESDLNKALEKLKQLNPQTVITDSANGCLWSINNTSGNTPALKIKAIDTNGAGDVFHGAFAYGLSQGKSFEKNILFATETAALSCTKAGIKHINSQPSV